MKTKLYLSAMAAIMIFVLTGCPYESGVSLGDAKDSKIDPQLSGTWIVKTPDPQGHHDTMIFIRFNDHEYYIESREVLNSRPVVSRGRGFITLIAGHSILNLNPLDNPGKIFFTRYSLKGDTLMTSYASDQFIKEKFSTIRELHNYYIKNMKKEEFYEPGDTLIRVKQ